jgi:hypothetical protein
MAGGLSAEAAAAKIGISARSQFYWQKIHPEFLQAAQEGRQKALLWWEERALAMAEGAPGSTQIIALALKKTVRARHRGGVSGSGSSMADSPSRPSKQKGSTLPS